MSSDHRAIRFGLWKGALFSSIIGGAVLIALELGLWVIGIETVITSEDPFRGFSGLVSVFERDGAIRRTREFGASSPFNEQTFLAGKPGNGLRIFTLGGSSAYGHPWGGDVAFTALLGETIAAAHPKLHVEAINAAGVSYAIHRLGIVADEIFSYQPDILIIYSGHNEFAEPTFYRHLKKRSQLLNRLEFFASHSRIYSAMHGVLAWSDDQAASPEARFEMFVRRSEAHTYDSSQKSKVAAQFRTELRRIVRRAHARGVKVVVATVPANLSQWRPNHSTIASPLDESSRSRWAETLAVGKRGLETGALGAARIAFNRAVEIAPKHAESHYLLGQAHEGLEQWQQARRHYELAADLDASPIRRTTAINQAIASVAAEESALLVNIEVIFQQLSTNSLIGFGLIDDYVHPTVEGHRIIAWHLWNALEDAGWLGQPIGSRRKVFDRVMSIRPTEPKSQQPTWLYNQGYMLAHQGHRELAIAKFRETVAAAPTFEPALSNLAQLLAAEGKDNEAGRVLEQLLRHYPENARGRVVLGTILARRGREDEAITEVRRAIKASPEATFAQLSLGTLLLKKHDFDGAKAAFVRASANDPKNLEAKLGTARVLASAGSYAEAAEQYRAIIRHHPSSATAHHELALLLLASDHREESLRLLRLAAKLAPTSPASPIAIGVIHLRAKQNEAAERQFQSVLRIAPDSAIGHNYLGQVLQSNGDTAKAMHHYSEAVRLNPDYTEAHANLARAAAQLGDTNAAIHHYRRTIRLRPDWPVPYNNLAWILATAPDPRHRDPTKAVVLAIKAIELMPRPTASALDTVAAAQAAAGRFDRAAETAKTAFELAQAHGAAEHASKILERMRLYAEGLPFRVIQ